MKIHRLHCLLLSALILLCSCNESKSESSERSVSTNTSSISEESTQEKEPVRYTYRSEAEIYDISELLGHSYNNFYYVGGDLIVCTLSQDYDSTVPLMDIYNLVTQEVVQGHTPIDDTEDLCRRFLGVRENGEFGLASRFGECVWFDKDGKYLGLDLWFDCDGISPEYHALIDGFCGNANGYSDNGDNLLCYYAYEKSMLENKGYYLMFDRNTGKTSEFLSWSDYPVDGVSEYYNVRGFVGKNHILYQRHTEAYPEQGGCIHTYSLHFRNLTTGEETVLDMKESTGGLLYLRETENGCRFVMLDRRWLKTMELSVDGTLKQIGSSYTVAKAEENSDVYFDDSTQTIAIVKQDEELGGNASIQLLDAETLTPYASMELPLEESIFVLDFRICHDGTVQILARNKEQAKIVLWRPEI